jgi:16S rRNA (adenine1518-N6/adenine1519-N6)-dimethyltransferase
MNLTSPSQVKAWCIENGFHPNKTLGQNFLIDRNILEAILDAAGVAAGQRVMEIGPGLGVLTGTMLARGAHVTAVEKDTRLAAFLEADMQASPPASADAGQCRIIAADALQLDWDALLGEGFDVCVSNLPYSVGTRILLDVALHTRAPRSFTVMVQTEVAERFAAPPDAEARGQAGVWLQLDYDVRLVRTVKASCFWPRPEVGSSIVRLDKHGCGLTAEERRWFFDLTRYAFMHRRKQLASSLRKAPPPLERDDAALAALFEASGIAPSTRAESLTNAQWQALARAFTHSACTQ